MKVFGGGKLLVRGIEPAAEQASSGLKATGKTSVALNPDSPPFGLRPRSVAHPSFHFRAKRGESGLRPTMQIDGIPPPTPPSVNLKNELTINRPYGFRRKEASMERAPRNKRIPGISRILIQKRDKEIILAVHENRFLRRDQIEKLFFAGSSTSACNQRLMKLYQHKFLDRLFLPIGFGSNQAVYALDRLGAEVVAANLGISPSQVNWKRKHNKVEYFFLEHTVGVSEVHVSLQIALRERANVDLLFWKREAFLPKDKVQDPEHPENRLPVYPDAFFGLQLEDGKSFFFIEVDMATEPLGRFRKKLVAYQQYWKSGQYRERYNYRNFRVLTVTTGPERMNNLLKVADSVGARNMFVFTVAELIPKDILGPIWFKPNSLNPTTILD
ncbi:MAG: replication-relaxation family protein [Actinobacteria bacterium]|nr:replication-relaxation family protein [Actinomycetota bacterium]